MPQFYLRSSIDDWKCLEERKFVRNISDEDETHYVFEVRGVEIPSGLMEFKIASEDWSTVNLGSSPYVYDYLLEERVVRTLNAGLHYNVRVSMKEPVSVTFVLHISKNDHNICFVMWKRMEEKVPEIETSWMLGDNDVKESARLSREALEPLVRELSKSWWTLLKEKLQTVFKRENEQQSTEPIVLKELVLNETQI